MDLHSQLILQEIHLDQKDAELRQRLFQLDVQNQQLYWIIQQNQHRYLDLQSKYFQLITHHDVAMSDPPAIIEDSPPLPYTFPHSSLVWAEDSQLNTSTLSPIPSPISALKHHPSLSRVKQSLAHFLPPIRGNQF